MKILKFIKKLFHLKCEFSNKCPYYKKDNYTCNHYSTDEERFYCGKYKEFLEWKTY